MLSMILGSMAWGRKAAAAVGLALAFRFIHASCINIYQSSAASKCLHETGNFICNNVFQNEK